jgi:hypothetical protein
VRDIEYRSSIGFGYDSLLSLPFLPIQNSHTQMIAMVIQHWLFLIELWDHPERSLHQASQVMKKHAFHLASVFHRPDELYRAIQIVQRCLAGCRMTKGLYRNNFSI